MGVARQHLVRNSTRHIVKPEQPRLFRHLGVKHHLQQQIAQLGGQFFPSLPFDRISHFMRLFNRIGRDGGEGLFNIPRAARGLIAQAPHNLAQTL